MSKLETCIECNKPLFDQRNESENLCEECETIIFGKDGRDELNESLSEVI